MGEETRTVGYICPVCGNSVAAEMSAFRLLAGDSKIPCPCGKSAIHIRQDGTNAEISVPCLFCAKDHRTACSNGTLTGRKHIALTCSKSGLAICHIGDEQSVVKGLSQLETAVEKLQADDAAGTRSTFLNSTVMEEALAEVKEIAARGGISCGCGSKDYGIRVGYSSVELVCAHCGSTLRLNAATQEDLTDLCARYTIEIPGRRR